MTWLVLQVALLTGAVVCVMLAVARAKTATDARIAMLEQRVRTLEITARIWKASYTSHLQTSATKIEHGRPETPHR